MKRSMYQLLFVVGCIASASAFFSARSTNTNELTLTLENAEALARGESSSTWCIGSGTIECNGAKVEVKYYAR